MKRLFWHIRLAFFFGITAAPWGAIHAEQPISPKVHQMAMFFTSNGWFNCAPRADQLGSFLGGNVTNQSFVVIFPTKNSNLIDVFFVAPSTNDKSQLTSAHLTFAANIKGCPAAYKLSNILEKSCSDALDDAQATAEFTEIGGLGHFIKQVNSHTTIRLAPQGKFCLKTQTEILD